MARDAALRSSLLFLGAIVLLIGIYTLSFKKMIATYVLGLSLIAGLVLPDWEFFDRDVSEWFSPMQADGRSRNGGSSGGDSRPRSTRFRIYPVRLVIFTTVYGFCLYKWWFYITK